MKVIELVDLVQDFFANDIIGDQKGVYHPAVIIGHLRNIYNQCIYEAWEKGKRESDFSQLDAWSRVYTVDVESQTGTAAYCFLPFTPAQLPDGMGIRQVSNHADNANVFAPIEAGANVVFAELEVDTMDLTPTYRLEQNNMATTDGEASHVLRLERLPVSPDAITELDVLMVVPLSEMGDYDEVSLPMGAEEDLVKRVIEAMTQKPPADTLNDMEATPTPQAQ
jgi:hypothetical protein